MKLQFSVNPVTTYEKGLTSYEAVSQRPQDFSFSPERRDAASLDAVMEEFIRLDFTS